MMEIRRSHLLLLIESAGNIETYNLTFLVPKHLERQMKWAIGKPFSICLWWEHFNRIQIQPNESGNELLLVDKDYFRKSNHGCYTTCR